MLEQVDCEHLEERTEINPWAESVVIKVDEQSGLDMSRKHDSMFNTVETRLVDPNVEQFGKG